MPSARIQTDRSTKLYPSEGGFILLWFSMTILGLLFAGFTFMLYTEATISKVKAQFIAMNLTIVGAYNYEFDSQEAINNMTMMASVMGFSRAIPTEEVQVFTKGALFYQHTTDPGMTNGVKAYVEVTQSPLTQLIANLGDIITTSYSLSKQSPYYLDLAFDYSSSLSGGSIDQLLEGFRVIDSTGAVDINGVPVGSSIEPNDTIQTVMPFAFEPSLGIALPWNETSAAWPSLAAPIDPTCTTTSETKCKTYSTTVPTHLNVLKEKASDIFMSYKKTAALLTGIAGRFSPYLDIHIFGGMVSDAVVTSMTDNLGASFPAFVNNGVYPIHLFDENLYTNYTLDVSNKIIGDVLYDYTYEDPKDIYGHAVSMSPDRILQIFLEMTFSRKLLKYGTLKDSLGATIMSPGTFSYLLDPPLPVIKDPQIADDSFTYTPGPLVNGTYNNQLTNELFYPFGWPGRPSPLLSMSGAAYPANADIPLYIRYPWEFNCSTGPQLDTAARINNLSNSIGNALCRIYSQCNPTIDCSASPVIIPSGDVYRKVKPALEPASPYCPATFSARCVDASSGGLQSAADTPICVNGTPRCFPTITYWPRCINGVGTVNASNPICCDMSAGACAATWDPTSSPPNFGTHNELTSNTAFTNTTTNQPVFRGRIEFPAAEGPTTRNNIFNYLNDLVPLSGGTWTQNTIPVSRCQEFKDYFAGEDPDCALILVTDSRPLGVNALGTTLKTDAEMISELTTNVDTFTGNAVGQLDGKIYTWYLNHTPSDFDDLVVLLQSMHALGTLDPTADAVFTSYIVSELSIPIVDCPGWDTTHPANTPTCLVYNGSILPEHLADETMYDDFKDLMSIGTNKVWIETTLTNTITGPQIPASFFTGLEELLVSLKKEVRFQK